MENIFEIDNLKCSYKKANVQESDIVLEIKGLMIPKGKVVFIVGPSGIGKSTILETLGFMNNTIASADSFKFMDIDISEMWHKNDSEKSEFRNQNFSFIFQDNNLMQNFTAYENVMATALIQGIEKKKAEEMTLIALKDMGLDYKADGPVFHYSGGERQRLAFARAILPDFKVLFGDEPTGNLDAKSADKLMKVLIDAVKKRDATAIIVSHDLNLSIKYADMIICIKKIERSRDTDGHKSYYGFIDEKRVFSKDDIGSWSCCELLYQQNELFDKLVNEL